MKLRTTEKKRPAPSRFREIIAFAIDREEEAAGGYEKMRTMVRDRGAKAFLAELRDEEKTHKRLLQDLARGRSTDAEPGNVPDLAISDFQVAEPPGEDMGYQDLLIFAARKEQKAAKLYTVLAAKAESEEARKLFGLLAGREMVHKLRLETEYESRFLGED